MGYSDPEDRRSAAKAHYRANAATYKARAVIHSAKTKAAVLDYLRQYLLCHPCVDCGESDIIVLEFDHRDGAQKRFTVSNHGQMGYSLKSVLAEVAKCDVRCANCHRRKTYRERGFGHRG